MAKPSYIGAGIRQSSHSTTVIYSPLTAADINDWLKEASRIPTPEQQQARRDADMQRMMNIPGFKEELDKQVAIYRNK